jgi:hypothetical protein
MACNERSAVSADVRRDTIAPSTPAGGSGEAGGALLAEAGWPRGVRDLRDRGTSSKRRTGRRGSRRGALHRCRARLAGARLSSDRLRALPDGVLRLHLGEPIPQFGGTEAQLSPTRKPRGPQPRRRGSYGVWAGTPRCAASAEREELGSRSPVPRDAVSMQERCAGHDKTPERLTGRVLRW